MIDVERTRFSVGGAPILFSAKMSAGKAARQLQALISGEVSVGRVRGMMIDEESDIRITSYLDSTKDRTELTKYSGPFNEMRQLMKVVETNLPHCLQAREPSVEPSELIEVIEPDDLEDSSETMVAIQVAQG